MRAKPRPRGWSRTRALGSFCLVLATSLFGPESSEARAAISRIELPVQATSDAADRGRTDIALQRRNQPCKTRSGQYETRAKGALLDATGGRAPCADVGQYIEGPPARGKTQAQACRAAKHALSAMVPKGCTLKHVQCI